MRVPGQSTLVRKPSARRVKVKRLSWHGLFSRLLLAGLPIVLVSLWMVLPASASSDFLGVLKGSPPLSPFVSSPASYDISSKPATVIFTTQVENLTNSVVTVTVDINVNHIITYYGRNVADGEPGKPGITFKGSDVANTTQETYGTPFQRTIVVQPKGAAPQLVSFSTVMTTCGYFQFDIGKHHVPGGGHDTLSFGFARVLGCTSGGGGGGVGGGGGGTVGGGTSGGVSGATAPVGEVLANTGLPSTAAGLLGSILMLIAGLGLCVRRRELRRLKNDPKVISAEARGD